MLQDVCSLSFLCLFLSFCVPFCLFFLISFPHIVIHTNTKTNHWYPKTQLNPPTSPSTQSESVPPPQEVTCISPSSTSLLLSWAPPLPDENGIITGYSIRYVAVEREKDPVQRISDIPSNCFRYRIEGLRKGSLYSVTVAAHMDAGQGPESLPVLVRTQADGMSPWFGLPDFLTWSGTSPSFICQTHMWPQNICLVLKQRSWLFLNSYLH